MVYGIYLASVSNTLQRIDKIQTESKQIALQLSYLLEDTLLQDSVAPNEPTQAQKGVATRFYAVIMEALSV